MQIKAVAYHSWVCDGSTARVSLTAPARAGSAAQLELGTRGCGWAAARARQQPKLNLELQVAFLGPGCSIYLNPYVPARLTLATVTSDKIGSGQRRSENFKSRAQIVRARQFEKSHTRLVQCAQGSLLFLSAYLFIFIELFFELFYSILIPIWDISSTSAVLDAKYFQPFGSAQVLLSDLRFISAGDSSRNFV